MATETAYPKVGPRPGRWPHRLIVPLLLLVAAVLAVTSFLGDSITFDETSHLTAGMSHLKTGDFRLAPDHPPLPKMWAALPLLLTDQRWPPPDTPGWSEGDFWRVGDTWLFELNDGERLIIPARSMMVVLLVATCLVIYAVAHRLFGRSAALLALALAVLCPNLLAHGRLVTTDVPMTLATLLTVWTFARLMRRITWGRILAAGLSAGALSLTKFSWPLVIPALFIMVLVAILRSAPLRCALWPRTRRPVTKRRFAPVLLTRRYQRALAILGATVLVGLIVWVALWTCYTWRYSPFRGPPGEIATMVAVGDFGDQRPTMDQVWEAVLLGWDGQPVRGLTPDFVRWARAHHALPEAYLYGIVVTAKTTVARRAYLLGEYDNRGWWYYFPVAFALKTPIATMLLLVIGLVALIVGRVPLRRDPVLLAGFLCFTLVYAVFSLTAHINIGLRHILPLYPAVFIVAGLSARWLSSRSGRWVVAGALLWLIAANLRVHPHYLAYFNELVGGPANGHLYLVDSNLDWGQDLKRLAAYTRRQPEETIKLSYFGSADPTRYGFACEELPPMMQFGAPAQLNAGTYVISVTQLLGVYDHEVRDSFWTREHKRAYGVLRQIARSPDRPDDPPQVRERRRQAREEYDSLARRYLFHRLRQQPPDLRIGWSLFVWRLSADKVERLLDPTTEEGW